MGKASEVRRKKEAIDKEKELKARQRMEKKIYKLGGAGSSLKEDKKFRIMRKEFKNARRGGKSFQRAEEDAKKKIKEKM